MDIWRNAVVKTLDACKEIIKKNHSVPKLTNLYDLCGRINKIDENKLDLSLFNGTKKEEIQKLYEKLLIETAGNDGLGFSPRNLRSKTGAALDSNLAMLFFLLAEAIYGVVCLVEGDGLSSLEKGAPEFQFIAPTPFAEKFITTKKKHPAVRETKEENTDTSGKVYVLHYVRSNPSRSDGDYNHPGFGSLQLLEEIHSSGKVKKKALRRKRAILRINYPSQEKVVTMQASYLYSGKTNLFVRGREIDGDRIIETQLSFAFNGNSQQLLIGTYSSVRRGVPSRDLRGTPICGMVVGDFLDTTTKPLSWVEDLMNSLETKGLTPILSPSGVDVTAEKAREDYLERVYAIRYFLADKRFSAIPGGSNNLAGKDLSQLPIDSYHLWKDNVESHHKGTYEGFYLKTTSQDNPTFEKFIFTIADDGRARLKTINRNVSDAGEYHGYVRVVNQSGGLLAYFDYQKSYDFYRFEMFLQPHSEKHIVASQNMDQLYLFGSFAGFEKYDENNPISGRIILRKIKESDNKPYSVPMLANPENKKILSDAFRNDKVIKRFFKGEGSAFKSVTDGNFWKDYFRDEVPEVSKINGRHVFSHFNQEGYAIFMYYSVVQNTRELHYIEKSSISITVEGVATLTRTKGEIFKGIISLIDNGFHATLTQDGTGSATIYLIISGFPGARSERIGDKGIQTGYGMCLICTGGDIEARYFAMTLNKSNDIENEVVMVNKLMTYASESSTQADRKKTLEKLYTWDKEHEGAVSYIMGSANRYLKTSRRLNDQFEPRTHQERKANFYSAFGAASMYKLEKDKGRQKRLLEEFKFYLRKAYLHGFASESFAGKHVDKAKMKAEKEERSNIVEMLKDVLSEQYELKRHVSEAGALSDAIFKSEVIALWPGLNSAEKGV